MRSIRHVTPRYIVDRSREAIYQRRHPDAPWLTPESTRILETMLRPVDKGVEFGSGRSTIWFAKRVARLTSVEHDDQWHAKVSIDLRSLGCENVDYVLAPEDLPPERGGETEYAGVAGGFGEASIDFALIDGIYRDHCARGMLSRIKPGGLLIVDNVNWYLPSHSRSPASRGPAAGGDGPVWAECLEVLRGWRWIWTSSGVWDTAIFVKPGSSSP